MLQKNIEKQKRKEQRELVGTFVGFAPKWEDTKKNYTRKRKHKKAYSAEE